MIQTLKRMVAPAVPTSWWISYLARRAVAIGEPELRLLPALLGDRGCLIDAGANDGPYSLVALSHGCRVIAFEPIPEVAQQLLATVRGRATVHQMALSDHRGTATLFIPSVEDTLVTPRAALDRSTHTGYVQREITVPLETLDSFDVRGVALIKIDVEGHEALVLAGARETLARERPFLLVEIEDHRTPGAMAAVRRILDPLGYHGSFLLDDQIRPLAEFDPSRHQREDDAPAWGEARRLGFVNNFIWAPDDRPLAMPSTRTGGRSRQWRRTATVAPTS